MTTICALCLHFSSAAGIGRELGEYIHGTYIISGSTLYSHNLTIKLGLHFWSCSAQNNCHEESPPPQATTNRLDATVAGFRVSGSDGAREAPEASSHCQARDLNLHPMIMQFAKSPSTLTSIENNLVDLCLRTYSTQNHHITTIYVKMNYMVHLLQQLLKLYTDI